MICNFKLLDLEYLSKNLIKEFSNSVICINGPLGSGKTTLISSICKHLGVKETVSSPTFSIINIYNGNDGPIYHFDFYRFKTPSEALDIGIEEYLESGHLCFLEWSTKINVHLPIKYNQYELDIIDENTRRIRSILK